MNKNIFEKKKAMNKIIKSGSDFSGVGAFDYAMERIAAEKGFHHQREFACDWDKYARITYAHNHGIPKYYPKDVYEREIPKESLDIYMTSPPCQAFSLAGNRKGKDDERGILFFNSHEFIKKNQPRFFIFENVKGLLSDNNGSTFNEWLNMLAGKSINGLPVLFPYENSVSYHLYWQVLNSKKHGVPQNRERVFLVGIRDDQDNIFQFPKEEYLSKKLKDVLENEVDEKYFLSEKLVNQLIENGVKSILDNDIKNIGNVYPAGNGINGNVFDENGISPTLLTTLDAGIKVKTATKKGFELATENDSINFSVPNSETRRGRVGKEVAQTLDTQCNQAVIVGTLRTHKDGNGFRKTSDNNCPTIPARAREDGSGQGVICIPVLTPDRIKKRQNGRRFKEDGDESFTVTTQDRHGVFDGYNIRRLTPRECFRLQNFPEEFDFSVVSDSQAYKQAGNSITVRVLEKILEKLNF